jgi:ubiquinone/menaquinone biosynthesis C-methylase UbiE
MPLRAQAPAVEPKAANLQVYRDPAVVSHYASLNYLTASERHLFDTYLTPGMAILDVGVGGGRTTPYLFRKASRYVGVDYSEEMIRLCRGKFPQLEFLVADASDLSKFADRSFDAIVFAFNGLDYVLPAEKRRQCLRECERVLRAGGVLMFSSHNPRSILVRPSWDPQILRALAERLCPKLGVGFRVVLGALMAAKSVHAFLRALTGSVVRIFRRVPTIAFWSGEGCRFDSAHGGLATHYWTPRHAVAEASSFGLRFETLLGDDYPRRSREFTTDWYYYVFTKVESAAGKSCA